MKFWNSLYINYLTFPDKDLHANYFVNTARQLVLQANVFKPQTLSSSMVNPRPALILVWYLNVGHLTIGRRRPPTGRGAIFRAFFCLFCLLRLARAGWLNQVLVHRCQSLWRCTLGIILFLLGAIVA